MSIPSLQGVSQNTPQKRLSSDRTPLSRELIRKLYHQSQAAWAAEGNKAKASPSTQEYCAQMKAKMEAFQKAKDAEKIDPVNAQWQAKMSQLQK
jgi:hypothetical protein